MIYRILKPFLAGAGIGVGLIASSILAVTINSTFNAGDTLTSAALNELKNALVALPSWTKGTNVNDAVYNDGNVGIGTPTPTAKLDVNGTVKATSFVGDGSGLTGLGGFTEYFTTADVAFTFNSLHNYAHGLTGPPKLAVFEFVCIAANNGYSVGDRVPFSAFAAANSGNRSAGYDATYVFFAIHSTASLLSGQKTTSIPYFTPSPTQWKVNVHAWR